MLELKNIAKKFCTKVIFDAFNLTINAGEVVAIAGPSGGGKTTLLRMLAGLESIDAGQVVFDEEVISLDELITRNLLGFVFQDFQLFPHKQAGDLTQADSINQRLHIFFGDAMRFVLTAFSTDHVTEYVLIEINFHLCLPLNKRTI